MKIGINFDFRTDTPRYRKPGVDPDKSSPTLRAYRQLLWSKPLPSGAAFAPVMVGRPGQAGWKYLYHRSELGEFHLSSDAVVPSWSRWKRMAHVIEQFTRAEIEDFMRLGYTIG